MAEDKDPFAEFGGSKIKEEKQDPFAEFGGSALGKKPSSKESESIYDSYKRGGTNDPTSLLSGRNQSPEIPTMLIGDAKKQAQEAVDKKKASLKRATEAYKAAHNGKLPQKEEKDKGGKGGVGTALAIGAAQFNEGVFKIPRYLYDLAAVPQNFIAEVSGHPELAADYDVIAQGKVNPLGIIDRLGDWANESGEEMQAQMPKYDKGVFDSLKDGNYGVAGEQVLNNIAQSVPSIIGMYVTGGAGNAAKLGGVAKTFVTALPFSSQKNAELQERTDIPDYIKPLNATFNGLAEVVFEQEFGTKAILDNVIGTFEREGRDAAVAAAKDFTTSYITKALKKVQPVTSTLKNSIEEMATQFSQNVIDWSTIDPSKDIMEGVADAGIIGGATGAGFSTIGGVSAGIFNSKQKTKLGEAAARRNDIVNDLDNPNLNESVKDQLIDDLEKVNDKIAGISDEAESKLTALPEKERTEAQELQTQIAGIESSLQDESVSESTKEALNKKVESLQEKLDVLVGASEIMKDADKASKSLKNTGSAGGAIPEDLSAYHNENIASRQSEIDRLSKLLSDEEKRGFFTKDKEYINNLKDAIGKHHDKLKLLKENPLEYYKQSIPAQKTAFENWINESEDNRQEAIDRNGSDKFEEVYSSFIDSTNEIISRIEDHNKNERNKATEEKQLPDINNTDVTKEVAVDDVPAVSGEMVKPIDLETTEPVTEENSIKANLPTIIGETVTPDVVKPTQAAEVTPEVNTREGTSVSSPSDDFSKLAHKNIQSEEVKSTLNNIERETGRELSPDEKEYKRTKLLDAVAHGKEVVDKAKEEFGDEYVSKTLNYLDENKNTMSVENKSLITISLELELERQIQEDPENELTLEKQLKMVRDVSTKNQRSAAIATGYGILRQIARVGYDVSQVTEKFFSPEESESRRKVEKAVQATAAEINTEAEMQEQDQELTPDLEKAISEGVEAQVTEIYNKLPKSRKERADKAIAALDRIQKRLRSKTYDATIGVPVAIIDAGITTIKAAIRAGVNIADAVELGINKIKEKHGAWAKEAEFRKDMIDGFKDEGIDSDSKKLDSKVQAQVTRLTNEIESINEQIKAGAKDAKTNKDPLTSPEIEKLKAERQSKLQELEIIDPTPSETIKNALIESGYGREINVKTKQGKEKRSIIDWTKLAGEEGSVDNIRNKVGDYLKGKGYSEAEIFRLQEKFVDEYNELHASIIDKSLSELQRRNTKQAPMDTKSSAKRLAELYNFGLFEKETDTYDYILNKALGMSDFSVESFTKAKKLARSLSKLYESKTETGDKISEFGLKHAVRNINAQIEDLLTQVSFRESNGLFKIASVTAEVVNLMQRGMLNSLKQIIENPLSGRIQRAFTNLGFSLDKIDTKALNNNRREISSLIYGDIVRNGGLSYGEITTPYISKSRVENWLNKQSDSKVYHTILTNLMGRAYLDGADSMHKAALTEKYFAYNLIKVLTSKTNPNKMTQSEATQFVADNLIGLKLDEAKETARQIIERINADYGSKIVPDTEASVARLANDLIKESLVHAKKLDLKTIEAAYDAAYTAAGLDLGHEANNLVSSLVGQANSAIDRKIARAVRDKKWNEAAMYTFSSIISRNVMNPFVGGGTNWFVLTLQKTGVDPVSPLYNMYIKSSNRLDVSTEEGIRNIEKALTINLASKNTNIRVLLGAAASMLTFAAIKSSGSDDDIDKWLKENEWARKYFNVFSPQVLIMMLAARDHKMGKYFEGLFNIKTSDNNDLSKAIKGLDGITSGRTAKINKGWGLIGQSLGNRISAPIVPWRVIKDTHNVIRGLNKQEPIKVEYDSQSFTNGFFKGGLFDYMGLRPKDEEVDENLREITITVDDKKTIYELSDDQVKQRNSYISRFNSKYADGIRDFLKRKGKDAKEIDKTIENKAKSYSRQMMIADYAKPTGTLELRVVKTDNDSE